MCCSRSKFGLAPSSGSGELSSTNDNDEEGSDKDETESFDWEAAEKGGVANSGVGGGDVADARALAMKWTTEIVSSELSCVSSHASDACKCSVLLKGVVTHIIRRVKQVQAQLGRLPAISSRDESREHKAAREYLKHLQLQGVRTNGAVTTTLLRYHPRM